MTSVRCAWRASPMSSFPCSCTRHGLSEEPLALILRKIMRRGSDRIRTVKAILGRSMASEPSREPPPRAVPPMPSCKCRAGRGRVWMDQMHEKRTDLPSWSLTVSTITASGRNSLYPGAECDWSRLASPSGIALRRSHRHPGSAEVGPRSRGETKRRLVPLRRWRRLGRSDEGPIRGGLPPADWDRTPAGRGLVRVHHRGRTGAPIGPRTLCTARPRPLLAPTDHCGHGGWVWAAWFGLLG